MPDHSDPHTRRAAAEGESRWGAAAATLAVIALHLALPERLTAGPRWALPASELALVVALLATNPTRLTASPATPGCCP